MGQLTPEESDRRQSIVDHGAESIKDLWAGAASPKLSPPTNQPAGATENQPHAAREAKICGNLFKGTVKGEISATYYPYNGWNYIGATKGDRDIYNGAGANGSYTLYRGYGFYRADCAPMFNPEYPRSDLRGSKITRALEKLAGNDDISAASRELLKKLRGQARRTNKVGQALPYNWDAHHILPMEAFYKFLESDQIAIIQRSDYDINTGRNMIFLPAQEKSMKYHQLPAHVDSHQQYTIDLKSKFLEIKNDLKQKKAQMKPHEAPNFLADKLHNLEDEKFADIAKHGPTKLL